MANYRHFVQISNPPQQLFDRKVVYGLFNGYGNITKIYIPPEGKEIKVYFSNSSEVVEAISALNGVPPHNLRLANKSEKNIKKSSSNTSINRSESINEMTDSNEIEANPGDIFYTFHGRSVTTFASDEGEIFVSLRELEKQGCPLFKERLRPKDINDPNYIKGLKTYLSYKARKYMKIVPYVEKIDLTAITDEVVRNFTTAPPLTTSQRPSRASFSPGNVPKPAQPNRSAKSEKTEQNATNSVTSLRKPLASPTAFSPKGSSSPKPNNASNGANNNGNGSNAATVPLHRRVPEYPLVDVPLNEPLRICVSHPINQKVCYVYLKSRQAKFTNLLLRVTKEAENSTAVRPVVGKMCAAQFEGEWYRAVVIQANPLKVMYVDFGNWNEEPVKELREISDELASEPAEAFCVNFGTNLPQKELKYDDVLVVTAIRQNQDRSYMVKIENDEVLSVKAVNNGGKVAGDNNKLRAMNGKKPSGNNASTEEKSKVMEVKDDSFNSIKNNPNSKNTVGLKSDSKTPIKEDKPEQASVRKSSVSSVRSLLKLGAASPREQKKATLNPDRKTVMEVTPPGAGVLQFAKILKDRCVCFICPHSAIEDLSALDSIGDETVDDPDYITKIGECVAVYKDDEEKWVRATIINVTSDKFTVALIDYGTIESVEKIRKLPRKIADLPEFVCLCFGSNKFLDNADKDTLDCEIIERNKVKVTLTDGTSEIITCQRWDPFLTSPQAASVEKPDPIVTVMPKKPHFYQNELVVLVNYYDGKFFVRSRDCKVALTDLQKKIAGYKAVPLKEPPRLNQIVLCPYENGAELHRGAVLQINGESCEVEYFDLGVVQDVPIDSLRSISEVLAKQELTLVPVELKDFPDDHHTEASLELVQKFCDDKDKFVLHKLPDGGYDLLLDNVDSLAKLLHNSGKDCVLFSDLPVPEVPMGIETYLCLNIERLDDDLATFMCSKGVSQEDIDKILNVTADMFEPDAYMPILDEVVFAEFEGEWFRARVIETNKRLDEHKVHYIDYGNEGEVTSVQIRKLMDGFESIAPLGITCKLEENEMKLVAGDHYEVEIMSCADGIYSAIVRERA